MLARLRRPLATFAGCAALALAAPLAAAAPEEDAAASAAPCASSKLVVWLPSSAGSGTAGSVYYRLRATNLGTTTCTLRGFPGVSAANLGGQPFGKPAARETNFKVKTVTLAPGSSASFLVRVVEAGNYSPSDCRPTEAAGFRVALPQGGAAKIVPFPFNACAKRSAPILGVGPFQKS